MAGFQVTSSGAPWVQQWLLTCSSGIMHARGLRPCASLRRQHTERRQLLCYALRMPRRICWGWVRKWVTSSRSAGSSKALYGIRQTVPLETGAVQRHGRQKLHPWKAQAVYAAARMMLQDSACSHRLALQHSACSHTMTLQDSACSHRIALQHSACILSQKEIPGVYASIVTTCTPSFACFS